MNMTHEEKIAAVRRIDAELAQGKLFGTASDA